MDDRKGGTTHSEYGAPYDSSLKGLFDVSSVSSRSEDFIINEVISGSKYQSRNIVAIGFKRINTQSSLPVDELFLTARGAVESFDQKQEANYKKLKAKSIKIDRLSHHLDNPEILGLLPDPNRSNRRLIPYYIPLDDDRVLALYITK